VSAIVHIFSNCRSQEYVWTIYVQNPLSLCVNNMKNVLQPQSHSHCDVCSVYIGWTSMKKMHFLNVCHEAMNVVGHTQVNLLALQNTRCKRT
jgi:hypothetical protein